jgi:UrcA family protein
MFNKSQFAGVALATVLSLALGHSASASIPSEDQIYSQTVSFRDLDLSKEQDAQTALYRISRAARSVCSGGYDQWRTMFAGGRAYGNCVKEATSKAVAHANQPMLTAAYNVDTNVRLAAK